MKNAPSPAQTHARRSVSAKLRGAELPEAFAEATVAAEETLRTRAYRRLGDAADTRRTAAKARKVAS